MTWTTLFYISMVSVAIATIYGIYSAVHEYFKFKKRWKEFNEKK